MKVNIQEKTVSLSLSSDDTYNWANKLNAKWPCSEIAGHRLLAYFDEKGLVDYLLDSAQPQLPAAEFNAICADFLMSVLTVEHPCWFVCVGQFQI